MLAVRDLRGCSRKNRLDRPVKLGDDGNGIQAVGNRTLGLADTDV
jgi:hypothetical protein